MFDDGGDTSRRTRPSASFLHALSLRSARLCTVFLLSICCSACNYGTDQVITDPPSRRAARGEKLPLLIKAREYPLRVKPVAGLEDIVPPDVLRKTLYASLPTNWDPPSVPELIHELKLWGIHSRFNVGDKAWSGQSMAETLLNDALCASRTVNVDIKRGRGGSFLIDSPYGIHVTQAGSYDAIEYRAETHYGKLTYLMAEVGLPLATPVVTSSGRVGTLADVLQDTVMRFNWNNELEFVACSLALWLPPQESWTNAFGETFTFDELMLRLLDRKLGEGSCAGSHVPYAVAMVLRVDEQYPILSARVRGLGFSWLRRVAETLEKNQLADGGWERDWAKTGEKGMVWNDPTLDQITIIGHHLEWMAFVPDEYRLSKKAIARAVGRLGKGIDELNPLPYRSFKTVLPCSHAARALCSFTGVDPFNSFEQVFSKRPKSQ